MSVKKLIHFGVTEFPSFVNYLAVIKGDIYGYATEVELEDGLVKEMTSRPVFIIRLAALEYEESKIFDVSQVKHFDLLKAYNIKEFE